MSPRIVHVEFHPDTSLWHATSTVNGAQYCVRGGMVKDVLHEFCRLLNRPARRWKVIRLSTDHLLCKELVDSIAEPPSTAEIPVFH